MSFIDSINKHSNGIIGTIFVHLFVFVWFNLENMSFTILNPKAKVVTVLDFSQEVIEIDENISDITDNNNNNQEILNVVSDASKKETDYSSEASFFDEQQANKEVMEELKTLEENEFKTLSTDNPELEKVDDINPNLIKEDAEKNKDASYGSNIIATANFYLPNRQALIKKVPSYKCQTQGVIRINIKVNNKGKIILKEIDINNSNSNDDCIIKNAMNYVDKWKFSQDFNDNNRKSGWIEFTYLRQ
jgi:hypothetical protein